jgi:probable F420-dependent oxidoreductase
MTTTGIAVPFSGPWATPENQVRVARRAEELGYGSLWTFSRLLFPLGSADERWNLPFEQSFREVCDPIVTLAYLAGHTERIRLGISVLNAPFYSPAVLAKQLIQLDRVSGGRLDAGMAQGWSPDEFLAAGVPMDRRLGRTLEYVEVIRLMWENEVAEFHGEFATLPKTVVRPRPVQPKCPVLLGGSGDKAWLRAGRLAAGWVGPSFATEDEIARAATLAREGAVAAGKDPDAVRVVVRAATFIRPAGDPQRRLFTGSLDEIAADLAKVGALGATEVYPDLNFDERIVGGDADPVAAMDLMEQALDAFAPRRR